MTVSQPALQSLHLVVCVHGFVGTPQDLKYVSGALLNAGGPQSFILGQHHAESKRLRAEVDVESQTSESISETIVVLNSAANVGRTFDGIDICSYNLLNEIKDQVKALRTTTTADGLPNHISKFSFVGHSLGGLIARFTLGLLENDGFFSSVPHDQIHDVEDENLRLALGQPPQPGIFATFATPHLGIPPDSRTGWPWLERRSAASLGRTGIQLYLFDEDWVQHESDRTSSSGSMGILEAMVQPTSAFISGLNRFPRIVSYANATYDYPVAFRTSALFTADPFAARGLKMQMDAKYEGIIASYSLPPRPASGLQRFLRRLAPPSVLNPRRIPLPFPLNYLALAVVPIGVVMAPFILAYVFINFRINAFKSNIRVRKQLRAMRLDAQRARPQQLTQGADERAQRAADVTWYSQSRAKLLGSPPKDPQSDPATVNASHVQTASPHKLSKLISSLITQSCPKYPLPAELPKGQRALTSVQLRIVGLWMSILGTKFERFFVKVEDVLDAHPLIVVRREENSTDIRGRSIVQHFIDHFITPLQS
ncbi:hypothetical protein OC845_001146 [Tilletia horrida]|nr:hypothetical protein OC845_001146 [Tilletia horrida]